MMTTTPASDSTDILDVSNVLAALNLPLVPLVVRRVALVTHVSLILVVTLLPFCTWDWRLLLMLLLIKVTSSAQWHVLGGCIMSRFEKEHGAPERSIIVEYMAGEMGVSYDTGGKLWVVFQNYVPSLVCLFKLYLLMHASERASERASAATAAATERPKSKN